jgi:hypothetical protein
MPDGSDDRLGYGALTAPELFETEPHGGSGAGSSLARRPDGHDTDHNAADWVTLAAPSPGRPNFQAHALSVEEARAEPPSLPSPGSPVTFTVHVSNSGLATWPGGLARLHDARDVEQSAAWLEALAPGEGRALRFDWRPSREERSCLTLRLVGAPGETLGVPVGCYQVGPPPVHLSEVMAAPAPGASEWLEIGNAAADAVDLGGYRLRDEDEEWTDLPAETLAAGAMLVLVQDEARFLAWWAGVLAAGAPPSCATQPGAVARRLGGSWPSLNNSPPGGRDFADRICLADATGTIIDHVVIGEGGAEVPAARTLERASWRPLGAPDRNWGPCLAPAGATPACPNSLSPPAAATDDLALVPNPFSRSGGGVHLIFAVGEGERGWEARIFDLWGHQLRDLGGDGLGPGPRDVVWDGRDDAGHDLPPGPYIALVRRHADGGRISRASKRLAVLAPAGQP